MLLGLTLLGFVALWRNTVFLTPPLVYVRDFLQEYLLGRAVVDGSNPYVPLSTLAARYVPEALPNSYQHTGGHPPSVAVVSAPLALLPYESASLVWFVFQVGLLPLLVVLVAAAQRLRYSALHVLVASVLLLLWHPISIELRMGQLTMLMVALILGSWVAFRRGRPRLAGALLGLSIGVKLMPFVVLAYFLVKRRWVVASWALGTFAASSVVAAGVLGFDAMGSYLTEGVREAAHWRAAWGNYAPAAVAWWLTVGTFEYRADSPFILPLIGVPWLASALSVAFTGAVLAVAGRVVTRSDDPDAEFGLAISTMLLVSPVVWQCYFVAAIWPLWVLGRRLYLRNWPVGPTNRLVAIVLLLAVPAPLFGALATLVGGLQATSGFWLPGAPLMPLLALSVVPILMFLMLVTELRTDPGPQGGRPRRLGMEAWSRVLALVPGRPSASPVQGPNATPPAGGVAGAS